MTQLIEDTHPPIQSAGLNTAKAVDFSAAPSVALPSATAINGVTVAALGSVTSTSATAFTVASTSTNYGLQIDESTGSAITGLKIKAAASGNGVALSALGGTNEGVKVDGKGTGTVGINTVGNTAGLVTVGNTTSLAGLAVNGPLTASVPVVNVTGATLAPTAAQTGSVFTLNRAAGITITLPVPAVGLIYRFMVETANTGTLKWITDAGTTLLAGAIVSATTTASIFNSVVATSNIAVTMNGTTTGGLVGTDLTFVCLTATLWQVSGTNFTSSTTATPFATS
jgi:hypothetical protein